MAGRSRRGECPLRERSGRAWNPGGQPDLPVLVSGGDGRAPTAHRERDALEPLPRLRRGQARTARLLPQLQRGVLGSTTLVGRSEAAREGKIDPKGRSLVRLGPDANAAAPRFDDALYRREPQSDAWRARPRRAHVGREDGLFHSRRKPRSGILYAQAYALRRHHRARDHEAARSVADVLDRVAD